MTCYKLSALIGWNYSIQTGEQTYRIFLKRSFPLMTALKFITAHVIYNLAQIPTENHYEKWMGCVFEILKLQTQ